MAKDYYMGLTLSPSAVGWACTDSGYALERAKGNDLWGVRLFNKAELAKDARLNRSGRRTRARKKARIAYLRACFADEIYKIDDGFYIRMDDSKFLREDKAVNQPNALFNDSKFKDRDYFNLYPTTAHLRHALIYEDKKFDIRLIYLGIKDIFDNSGHFYLPAFSADDGIGDISDLYSELCSLFAECYDEALYTEDTTLWLEDVLKDMNLTAAKKAKKLDEITGYSKKDKRGIMQHTLFDLISGRSVRLMAFCPELDEESGKTALKFSDSEIEEMMGNLPAELPDNICALIMCARQIYDWSQLAKLMQDNDGGMYKYISDARVAAYKKHGEDLALLKSFYKTYLPEEKYNSMFRDMEQDNYSAYIGSTHNGGKKTPRHDRHFTPDKFFTRIQNDLKDLPESDDRTYILSEIEKNTFLQKQTVRANSILPEQLHKKELTVILENAQKYYPFLSEKDESGLTVSERIMMVFEYRTPYFIGPIPPYKGFYDPDSNMWAVRKSDGRVYPWNVEEKIDIEKTVEQYKKRLIRDCTYIYGEKVLPKCSLLYEKYAVLNELNALKINGDRISVQLKQSIYNDLFMRGGTITHAGITRYLTSAKGYTGEIVLTGTDSTLTTSLSSYPFFTRVFETDRLTAEQEKIAETCVYWCTVFGKAKRHAKEKITELYSGYLSKAQIDRISAHTFSGWGKFSKEFLTLKGCDVHTGEILSVIDRMWAENLNLMEIVYSANHTYGEMLEDLQLKIEKKIYELTPDVLNNLYLPSPTRRMVWQALKVTTELVKAHGEPDRIFLEVSREPDSEKEKKPSRKEELIKLYKNYLKSNKQDKRGWIDEISALSESEFKKKKVFLYYLQMGRDIYTGKDISFKDLSLKAYNCDHIYPQHYVTDNSLHNNLVLTSAAVNSNEKMGIYPVPAKIRNNPQCRELWDTLKKFGFMTGEKYSRLTRSTEFSNNELAGFISKTLTEKNRAVKVISNILRQVLPDTRLLYTKASNVDDFRHSFGFLRSRTVNELHYANEAYLSIVVGNVYNTKFTDNPINFINDYRKDPKTNPYNLKKMYNSTVARNGCVAWYADGRSLTAVKGVMSKTTPLITHMTQTFKGQFYDQMLIRKDDIAKVNGRSYSPIKSDDKRYDVCRYGGYGSSTTAHFFLVEHTENGEKVKDIETMLTRHAAIYNTPQLLKVYCETELHYTDVRICIPKIQLNTLIKYNGFYYLLTGRSNDRLNLVNATTMLLEPEYMLYARLISNNGGYREKDKTAEELEKIYADLEQKGITAGSNLKLYKELVRKHTSGIFARRINSIGQFISHAENKFSELSVIKQIEVLNNIILMTAFKKQNVDLSLLGGPKCAGTTLISKRVQEQNRLAIIRQSATGLHTTEMDLQTV